VAFAPDSLINNELGWKTRWLDQRIHWDGAIYQEDWNHSELVKDAIFTWADGTPINFSSLQTSTGQKLSNPGGTLGNQLAGAHPFQGNIRVRYDLAFNGYDALAQIGGGAAVQPSDIQWLMIDPYDNPHSA
jgi:iron complex outermembrane receptor protein